MTGNRQTPLLAAAHPVWQFLQALSLHSPVQLKQPCEALVGQRVLGIMSGEGICACGERPVNLALSQPQNLGAAQV